jgi:L-amino acid N-acyltransferase YncA
VIVTVRPASIEDLPGITEIHNYYIVNTQIIGLRVERKFDKYWDVLWMERPLGLP